MVLTRVALRGTLVVALIVQGVIAWRATASHREYRTAMRAFNAGDARRSVEGFGRLLATRTPEHQIGAWQADAAQAALDTSIQLDARERSRLVDIAWSGYASAVLRCPADSWSWSGLAEVALRRAAEADRQKPIDLAEVAARADGTLDAWRAVALGAAKLATALKPSGYQELDTLASVHRSMGDLDATARAYEASARMMPAPSFHSWGETPLSPPSLYETIVRGVESGMRAAPAFEASRLHLDFGRFAERNGDLNRALTEYRASRATVKDDFQRFDAAYETARLLAVLGRLDEALVALGDASDTGLGTITLRRLNAVIRSRQGDFATACTEWVAVLREHQKDEAIRLLATGACDASGEPQLAERLFREGIAAPSDSPRLAQGLIEFLLRHRRPEAAADLIRIWRRDDPAFIPGSWAGTVEAEQP